MYALVAEITNHLELRVFCILKTAAGQQDCITAQTCLTRITVLYYSVCQTVSGQAGCLTYLGPCNTRWSEGIIANWNTLTYNRWLDVNGCNPPSMVGNTYVCHLIAEDIYFQVTFNSWGEGNSNFSYTRTTEVTLPVKFLDVEGSVVNKSANIFWSTASEANSKQFNIQSSADGRSFTNIGTVASKVQNGNSTSTLEYNFTAALQSTITYYRIQQVDIDGNQSYSKVVTLKAEEENKIVLIQNPILNNILLSIPSQITGMAEAWIYDAAGKKLKQETINLNTSRLVISSSGLNLMPGTYVLQIKKDGKNLFRSFFVKQ